MSPSSGVHIAGTGRRRHGGHVVRIVQGQSKVMGLRRAKTGAYLKAKPLASYIKAKPLASDVVVVYDTGPIREVQAARRAAPDPTNWIETVRRMVASFGVAVHDPDPSTTVDVEFKLRLLRINADLDDVTQVVRDELKSVVVPDSWTKRLELLVDDPDTNDVLFRLSSSFSALATERSTAVRERTGSPLILMPPCQPASDTVSSTADSVELTTETGSLTYVLPLSLDHDTIGSMEVSQILSASDKPNRALANSKRKANQLLGLKVGNQYRYPLFQFDRGHKRIKPSAAYANEAMECDLDPWGTLDWWFTTNSCIQEQRPVDRLAEGALTERDIDRMVALEQQGMD